MLNHSVVDRNVTNVLASMTHMQLVEVMHQLKALAQANPAHVKGVLTKNPQLTKALFQAQLLLGMIKPPGMPQAPQQQQAPPPPQDAAAQQALLQQVMSMTDEQVAMLPPEQKA